MNENYPKHIKHNYEHAEYIGKTYGTNSTVYKQQLELAITIERLEYFFNSGWFIESDENYEASSSLRKASFATLQQVYNSTSPQKKGGTYKHGLFKKRTEVLYEYLLLIERYIKAGVSCDHFNDAIFFNSIVKGEIDGLEGLTIEKNNAVYTINKKEKGE